jgi:predicted ferric reductase
MKLFVLVLIVMSPLAPMSLYFAGSWYSFFHSYSLGMSTGIISYVYFLNTLILSSRIPFFDRIFGHDRVIVLHGYLAAIALVFAIAHVIFKTIFYFALDLQTILGITAITLFFMIMLITSLFMVKGRLHRIPVINRLRDAFTGKRIDYSRLKSVHNLMSFAAFIVAIHVLLATATQENNQRTFMMIAWASVAIVLYLYHKIIRVVINKSKKLVILQNSVISSEVNEITIGNNDGSLQYKRKPGQFAYFRFYSKFCKSEEHPFTISSPVDSTALSITVKQLGDYTSKMKHLETGTSVCVDGPYGVFSPKLDKTPLLFIAGGIGITPFLSIVPAWEKVKTTHPLILLWSVRTKDELIHKEYFVNLMNQSTKFTFGSFVTRPSGSDVSQRLNGEVLDQSIPKELRSSLRVYICGPESLRVSICKELKGMGIGISRVHYEKFSF